MFFALVAACAVSNCAADSSMRTAADALAVRLLQVVARIVVDLVVARASTLGETAFCVRSSTLGRSKS